jgi:hypothetical protein
MGDLSQKSKDDCIQQIASGDGHLSGSRTDSSGYVSPPLFLPLDTLAAYNISGGRLKKFLGVEI